MSSSASILTSSEIKESKTISKELLSADELKEIRLAFQADPTLLKIRRYWDKASRTPRSKIRRPFTPLEEKLKLEFSVIATIDAMGNKLIYAMRREKNNPNSSVRLKHVNFLGWVDESKKSDSDHSALSQLVKIITMNMYLTSIMDTIKIAIKNECELPDEKNHNSHACGVSSYNARILKGYIVQDNQGEQDLKTFYENEKQDFFLAHSKEEIYARSLKKLKLTLNLLIKLQALHERNILHRDIKNNNIVTNDGETGNFVDFGCAIKIGASYETSITDKRFGNEHFMAPEVTSHPSTYSRASDIYSMGITLRHIWWSLSFHPISKDLFDKVDKVLYGNLLTNRRRHPTCLADTIKSLEFILEAFKANPRLDKTFKTIVEKPVPTLYLPPVTFIHEAKTTLASFTSETAFSPLFFEKSSRKIPRNPREFLPVQNALEFKTFKDFYLKIRNTHHEMVDQSPPTPNYYYLSTIIRTKKTPGIIVRRNNQDYYALLSGLLNYGEEAKKFTSLVIKKESGAYRLASSYPYNQFDRIPYDIIEFEIHKNETMLSRICIFQLCDLSVTNFPSFITYHSNPNLELNELLHTFQPLFESIKNWKPTLLSKEADEKSLYYLIGLLLWHVMQATYHREDSEKIGDKIVESLLKIHGFHPKNYKPEIKACLRAISTPTAEEFAKTFYNLFINTPDFVDPFEINLTRIKNYEDETLNPKRATHKDNSIEPQNIIYAEDSDILERFYYSVNKWKEGLQPSIHRYEPFKRFIAMNGHRHISDYFFTYVNFNLTQFKGNISKDKFQLLMIGENTLAVWLAMHQELAGESFYARQVFISKEDKVAWLNLKSLDELKKISADHHIFHTALFWLEELETTDRDLLQEHTLSRQDIISLGVEGLKARLDMAKANKTSSPSSSSSSECKEAASEVIPTQSTIALLLLVIKYHVPPSPMNDYSDEAAGKITSEGLTRINNVKLHGQIQTALLKLSIPVLTALFNVTDQTALEKGYELFTHLRREFSAVLQFIRKNPRCILPEDKPAFVVPTKPSIRAIREDVLYRKPITWFLKFSQIADNNFISLEAADAKELITSLRLRDQSTGQTGLMHFIRVVPHALPQLLEKFSKYKETAEEFAMALKLQDSQGITAFCYILFYALKTLPELWKFLSNTEEGPGQVSIIMGLQSHTGRTGLSEVIRVAPESIFDILKFIEKTPEGPEQLLCLLSLPEASGLNTFNYILRNTLRAVPEILSLIIYYTPTGFQLLLDLLKEIKEGPEFLAVALTSTRNTTSPLDSLINTPDILNPLLHFATQTERGKKIINSALSLIKKNDNLVNDTSTKPSLRF